MLINMALKTWVFPKADQDYYYSAQGPVCDALNDVNCKIEPKEVREKIQRDQRSAQKQRDAAQALAMIIVATPVFLYHWKLARKEV